MQSALQQQRCSRALIEEALMQEGLGTNMAPQNAAFLPFVALVNVPSLIREIKQEAAA